MYLFIYISIIGLLGFTKAQLNNSNAFEESSAVVKVTRGVRLKSDSLDICSQNAEPLDTHFNKPEVAETMDCTSTDAVECKGWPMLKRRYHCTCKNESQLYAGSRKHCVSNEWLREGCAFRFGSWKYNTGWKWNQKHDAVLSLYFDPGYAITGSFNMDTRDYRKCYMVNITILNEDGQWELFTYDPKTVQIYTLRKFFQLSWVADNVDSTTKEKLSGKLFRLYLSCDKTEVADWEPLQPPLVSCLVFKATGNTTFIYAKVETETGEGSGSNVVGVAVGVTFALIVIIVGAVLGFFIYRRRRGAGESCSLPELCWKKT